MSFQRLFYPLVFDTVRDGYLIYCDVCERIVHCPAI